MKYGFIGCGNMGSALIRALSRTTNDILIADISAQKAEDLANELNLKYGENEDVIKNCERIFLGVKPQMMAELLNNIAPVLKSKKPLLISMAAGLTTSSIEQMAGGDLPVIRIMPNTPVSVGKGTVLYCTNSLVKEADLASFVEDIRYAGVLDKIDEDLIDAGCSVSGCGPAYMYMFIDAIAKAGEQCGLSKDTAIKYAANTMLGAAQMVLDTNEDPDILKQKVCSPGGSTIEGVKVLENKDFEQTVIECITAAFKRNKELGKG
ncbi:MAG: pyrroline-5-carboxylate reductase [Clostridia bacterium]|nr:pyrroline-5-carboxylate reductase [Clostridia bacterium]